MTSTTKKPDSGGTEVGSRESSEFEFIERSKNGGTFSSLPPPAALPSFLPMPTPPSSSSSPSPSPSTSTSKTPSAPSKSTNEEDSHHSLFGWMKGASGGLLSKVAEKTKNSVESVITTLDPQMKDYMYPGTGIEVVVASDKENKINPVRNAFQNVFGRVTVYGSSSHASTIAEQPVGFAAGRQAVRERIQHLRKNKGINDLIIVALQTFLLETGEDSWIEMGVLNLNDPINDITITTYTQPTVVDVRFVDVAKEATPETYPQRWSGLKLRIGDVIGKYLGVPPNQWHGIVNGGTTFKEIVLHSSVTLAGMYQKALAEKLQQV